MLRTSIHDQLFAALTGLFINIVLITLVKNTNVVSGLYNLR